MTTMIGGQKWRPKKEGLNWLASRIQRRNPRRTAAACIGRSFGPAQPPNRMEAVMKYHLMGSMGNTTLTTDPGAQLELFDDENRRPVAAHIWRRQADGFYVDPAWVAERLFAAEKFIGSVWDPGCGVGRVADASRRRGYKTYATDIVDRGYQHFDQTLNFLLSERPLGNNIITNPPFQICDQFLRHALKLDVDAVAMIWLARRLNAAHWLADTPLARVYLLTPRPSMPAGEVIARGEKPRGGKQDFRLA